MIRKISYTCRGTCSRQIDIELDGETIRSVVFTGGCHGNTQGIAALVSGMPSHGSKASTAAAREPRAPISWPAR